MSLSIYQAEYEYTIEMPTGCRVTAHDTVTKGDLVHLYLVPKAYRSDYSVLYLYTLLSYEHLLPLTLLRYDRRDDGNVYASCSRVSAGTSVCKCRLSQSLPGIHTRVLGAHLVPVMYLHAFGFSGNRLLLVNDSECCFALFASTLLQWSFSDRVLLTRNL